MGVAVDVGVEVSAGTVFVEEEHQLSLTEVGVHFFFDDVLQVVLLVVEVFQDFSREERPHFKLVHVERNLPGPVRVDFLLHKPKVLLKLEQLSFTNLSLFLFFTEFSS